MNTRKEKKFNEILGQKKLKKKYMFKRDLKPSTINDSLILIKKKNENLSGTSSTFSLTTEDSSLDEIQESRAFKEVSIKKSLELSKEFVADLKMYNNLPLASSTLAHNKCWSLGKKLLDISPIKDQYF